MQSAVNPLAARALFGLPSAELSAADFDAGAILGRRGRELRERVGEARPRRRHDDLTLSGQCAATRR